MKDEEKILAKAEGVEDQILSLLQRLVRIPSPTGEEGEAQEFLAKYLKSLGLKAEMWEPDVEKIFRRFPDRAQYPSHWQSDLVLPYTERPTYHDLVKSGKINLLNYKNRPNLICRLGADRGGRSLILNGHIDTVPVEPRGEWAQEPYGGEILKGKLYGRGASDMKAGIAAAIGAIQAILEAGVKLKGEVILESVVNEEHSGNGTLACVGEGIRADAAIVTEPTGNTLCIGTPGGLHWEVRVRGNPSSAGARWNGDRQVGVSAIEKIPRLIQEFLELERRQRDRRGNSSRFSLVIGKVEGGTYETATASACRVRGVVYFGPDGGDLSEAREMLRRSMERASQGDRWLEKFPPELLFLHEDDPSQQDRKHPLVSVAAETVLETTGVKPPVQDAPFPCDMRHLRNQGKMPTIIYGPGSINQAHRPDEYFPVKEMLPSVRVLALTVYRWCNGTER